MYITIHNNNSKNSNNNSSSNNNNKGQNIYIHVNKCLYTKKIGVYIQKYKITCTYAYAVLYIYYTAYA